MSSKDIAIEIKISRGRRVLKIDNRYYGALVDMMRNPETIIALELQTAIAEMVAKIIARK